jgi:hypothetical protein
MAAVAYVEMVDMDTAVGVEMVAVDAGVFALDLISLVHEK